MDPFDEAFDEKKARDSFETDKHFDTFENKLLLPHLELFGVKLLRFFLALDPLLPITVCVSHFYLMQDVLHVFEQVLALFFVEHYGK